MNLYQLDNESTGIIDAVNNPVDSKVRLAEMGIMLGVEVRMIKKTPFNGPVHIKINNYYLTLRKEDAEMISIKKEIK